MSKYNWAAIKTDYETGLFSFNDLTEKYGAAKSTIGKKAKAESWQKGKIAEDAAEVISQLNHTATTGQMVLTAIEITNTHKNDLLQARDDLNALRTAFVDALKPEARKFISTKDGTAKLPYPIKELTSAGKDYLSVLTMVHDLERQAYGMNAKVPIGDKDIHFEFIG